MPFKHLPVMKTNDSSKMQAFEDCPRLYFMQHRLGWQSTKPSLALTHGTAIHEGIRQLYLAKEKSGSFTDGYEAAYMAYLNEYIKVYPIEDEWVLNSPKNPIGAQIAFATFCEQYAEDNFKLIGAEIWGSVPIAESREIIAKLDCLIETEDGVLVIDNKTASRSLTPLNIEEAEMKIQFFNYNLMGLSYALTKGFKPADLHGLLVNHIAFKETKRDGINIEHSRFQIKKSEQQMNQWVQEANQIIDMIEWHDSILDKDSPEEETMLAFPRRLGNCVNKYFRKCAFYDFCRFFPNPLRFQDKVQPGFEVRFWDPKAKAEDAEFEGIKECSERTSRNKSEEAC